MRFPPSLLARFAEILSDLFPTRGDITTVIDEVGLDASRVNQEQSALNVWTALVDEANKRSLIRPLLTVAQRHYDSGDAASKLAAIEVGIRTAEEMQRRPIIFPKKT